MPVETFDFARDSKVFQSYFWLRSTKHTQSAKRRVRLSLDSTRLDSPGNPKQNCRQRRQKTSAWCGRIQLDVVAPPKTSNFFIPATYRLEGYYDLCNSLRGSKSCLHSQVALYIFPFVWTHRSQRLLEPVLPNLVRIFPYIAYRL